jgi:DNA-binding NarL/FixJ family response regulator
MRARVLIGEEECLVREGLARLLGDDFEVVASVVDRASLVAEARRLLPDAVVVGVGLLLEGGAAVARELRAAAPGAGLVAVASAEAIPPALVRELSGWVQRSSTPGELRRAVRLALPGRAGVPSAARQGAAGASFPTAVHPDLSPRALEVLRHLAEGKLMKQVAADLGIATRTVAFHKYRAMKQLGLNSNAALVRYAVRAQIV